MLFHNSLPKSGVLLSDRPRRAQTGFLPPDAAPQLHLAHHHPSGQHYRSAVDLKGSPAVPARPGVHQVLLPARVGGRRVFSRRVLHQRSHREGSGPRQRLRHGIKQELQEKPGDFSQCQLQSGDPR